MKELYNVIREPFIILLLGALLLCCVSFSPDSMSLREENGLLPMLIPHITIASNLLLYAIFGFSFLIFLLGIFKRKQKDSFSTFLWLRLILFAPIQFIIYMIIGDPISLGNYFIYLMEAILYVGCISCLDSNNLDGLKTVLRIVVAIIAVETIYQAVFGVLPEVQYVNPWYKSNLVIPAGATNTLSAIILPVLVAEYFSPMPNKRLSLLFIIICALAVILTKSRFAMGIMILAYIIVNRNNKAGKLAVAFFVLTLLALAYFLITNWDMVSVVLYGFSDEVGGSTADNLSSGRVSGMSTFIDGFLDNPIFGNGPNYKESRAHNIIIDVLFQLGILGLFLFCYSIKTILRYHKKLISENNYQFFYAIVITSLVQSLGEITFFTDLICDMIFLPSLAALSYLSKNNRALLFSRNK